MIEAARYLQNSGSVRPVLLGDSREILGHLKTGRLTDVPEIIDPRKSDLVAGFAELYRDKMERRGKPAPRGSALIERMRSPSYFAAMLLELGEADGLLGGSSLPTAAILRAALEVVGLAEDSDIVSGNFGMFLPSALPSGQKNLVFADCAVVPNPDSEQLAAIAINAMKVSRKVLGLDPKVAFLSFSTNGSADHPMVDKVIRAKDLFRARRPDAVIDGEVQVDAALIPEVAVRKAPDLEIGGGVNTLIFPDLNAGNIAYKLVERLAGATALGVILEGFRRPVNDLSRGCSTQDVIDMTCVTALQKEEG